MDCPGRTLVAEAKPSIQGQRYFVRGSIRVFSRSHWRVPGSWFSRCTRFNGAILALERRPEVAQPARVALAPRTPLRRARRLIPGFAVFGLRIPGEILQLWDHREQGKIGGALDWPREAGYV